MSDHPDRDLEMQRLEEELSELLTEGELKKEDQKRKEREQISPKYEIRIQTTLDPIVEETKLYRLMAEEIDDRYDEYLQKTRSDIPEKKPGKTNEKGLN
ncbi:hypothetical protein [Saccharibacillus sp. JS10]|uniref:hypothetical protein n=1 Tax=Saccharibacillus sp. JS10 TaxID=2950552 RepID=UPI00210C70A4|nr:hypothetical protein [Saccharibacillus sp. JS10]MCQ4087303.1 hypothetical protein [Saccharibacillus sp. JS10]